MTLQTIRHQHLITTPSVQTEEESVLLQNKTINPIRRALKQLVYLVEEDSKDLLTISLLKNMLANGVLIYVRTNSAADLLAEKLNRVGIVAESLHGNKSQRTKIRTLANFRSNSTEVIVATDSASSDIALVAVIVINYDLPISADTYGKRIARHAADDTNTFISFCDISEQPRLININREFPAEIEMI